MTLHRLLPNLYWFADTCNVYLLVDGQRGLLFDFGSGQILDHLHEAGVAEVEWVLHTHHHRDQAQGDYLLAERGIPIAEPGAVHAIHDLQWQYGFPDGVGAALHSTLLVRSKQPDLVLGSHGHPIA